MKIMALFIGLLIAGSVFAQAFLKDDPKRPVNAVAKELGVTPEQFRKCFADVKPSPHGMEPSAEKQRSNKKILLPCLQQFNQDITNDKLDAVMDKYRK